jgi:hypothetical protein
MNEFDKLEDYLNDQSSYDRYPASYKVRELHHKVVSELKDELNKLRAFKDWCIFDVKYCTTPKRWDSCDMKRKLDELGLYDGYSNGSSI